MSGLRVLAVSATSALFLGTSALPALGNYPVITTTSPRTGTYSLEACGGSDCIEAATQVVRIPDQAVSGNLNYWFRGITSDTTTEQCEDAAVIQLSDLNNPEFVYQDVACQDEATGVYLQHNASGQELNSFISDHQGEYISVEAIGVTNDDGQPSQWFIDDVAFNVATETSQQEFLGPTQLLCDPGFESGPNNPCWLEHSGGTNNGYTVTVTKTGSGTGTVAATDWGLNCGTDCENIRSPGDTVTLKATPTAGSTFKGWGGACAGETSNTCEVTFDTDKTVEAEFAKPQPRGRTISMALQQHLVATGKVNSGYKPCEKQVKVTIQKLKNGKWDKIKSDKTNNNGIYGIFLGDKPGKYRAVAPKFKPNAENVCKTATSKPKRHRH